MRWDPVHCLQSSDACYRRAVLVTPVRRPIDHGPTQGHGRLALRERKLRAT